MSCDIFTLCDEDVATIYLSSIASESTLHHTPQRVSTIFSGACAGLSPREADCPFTSAPNMRPQNHLHKTVTPVPVCDVWGAPIAGRRLQSRAHVLYQGTSSLPRHQGCRLLHTIGLRARVWRFSVRAASVAKASPAEAAASATTRKGVQHDRRQIATAGMSVLCTLSGFATTRRLVQHMCTTNSASTKSRSCRRGASESEAWGGCCLPLRWR